jgi:predicted phage terminase large subunit-like protein
MSERAFAPDVFSLDEIKAKRAEMRDIDPSERTFYSQWQNEPRAPTSDLFREPARYVSVPDWPGFRDVIGLDMAYSTARVSDWSAIVVMRVYGNAVYIRDVQRVKLDVGAIRSTLRAALQQYGRAPIYSYVSGPEKGIVADLNDNGIPVQGLPARYNKLVRAQRTVDRWNAGKIMVPSAAPWLEAFLGRVASFRGTEGDDDDEVDAMVSAHDGALGVASSGNAPLALGSRRM